MVEEWKPQDVDNRFGTYVEELRDFFASRTVPFGNPGDVAALTARLSSSAAFAEEMGSMVRSIVFSEGEHMRRGDLLALVAVASGGPAVDARQQEVAEAAQTLQHFLDTATRQQWAMFAPATEEVDEAPAFHSAPPDIITASEILAAEPFPQVAPQPWPPQRLQAEPAYTEPVAPRADRGREPNPFPRATPHSNEVLFRAVRMAAAQKDPSLRTRGWRSTLGQWWSIPAAALALVAIAAGVQAGRARWTHQHPTAAAPGLFSLSGGGELAGSCVASPGPGVSRSALEERSRWAHNLLEQKLYASALPELRTIAHLDPGYPAIQLDESDALLNLKRPDEAREAVDEQINVAECLARLPAPALDAYCTLQYGPTVQSACRPQLEHIRQAAQLQAALVHLELGHRLATNGGTAAAVAELRQSETANSTPAVHTPTRPASALKPKRQAPLPPASEDDTAQPPIDRPVGEPR